MSYCKFGPDSDISLYAATQDPDNTPCWVLLTSAEEQPETFLSRQEVYDRLLTLRDEGRRVPDVALDRLQREMSERRRKIVRITPQLLYEILAPGPAVHMRCTRGIPANATFIGMSYDLASDCYNLCFESSEWDPVPYGERLPLQEVWYRRLRLAPLLDRAASMLADMPASPERDRWLEQWQELRGQLGEDDLW